MNSGSISGGGQTVPFDPQALLGDLDTVKQEAKKSIQKALTMLGTVLAQGSASRSDVQQLESPSSTLMSSVQDLSLRIAYLQETLDQLTQQVSKEEIKGRMNEMQKQNTEQLKKIEKQIEEAQEAARKQKEAQKKSNVFEAVANWFQAAISFASAIFTAVTAVGYLFTNPVAAVGLFVASAAMIATGICQTVLAIDATVRAAGGEGFLDEKHKANLQKAAEICGYIALGASLLSGIAVVLKGVQVAASMATSAIAKYGTQELAKQAMKEGAKAAAMELAKQGSKNVLNAGAQAAKEAFIKALKPLMDLGIRQAILTAIGQGGLQITKGVMTHEISNLQEDAAAAKKRADEAEAGAKALEGQIAMLRKLIAELQEQLEEMMEGALETMSIIFKAVDDTSESMTMLHQIQSA